MLRQLYLCNPPLDHVTFWICCASHTPLLTDRRDWKAHNSFDINHHRKFPGKQKEIHLQGSFGRRQFLSFSPLDHAYFWICGAPRCCLTSGRWRSEMHSPARRRHVEQQLVHFQVSSDLWRSNRWIIRILRYIVQNSIIYILTVGFKEIIIGG